MTRVIDLNADLGEGCPWDIPLLARVSSTSVCCGAHAGEPNGIRKTLAEAARLGVSVGSHPGYADREGFGRRDQDLGCEGVRALIVEQTERLAGWASGFGLTLRFVKPHGALYNQAQKQVEVAQGVLDAVEALGLPLLGQPGSVLGRLAIERGVRFIGEGFPDRRYLADGSLAPRSLHDACLYEASAVAENVERLLGQGIETLCIHGDDARALGQAELLRGLLADRGWTLRSL